MTKRHSKFYGRADIHTPHPSRNPDGDTPMDCPDNMRELDHVSSLDELEYAKMAADEKLIELGQCVECGKNANLGDIYCSSCDERLALEEIRLSFGRL